MLQSDTADDYVLGTGKMYSVREFVVCAFRHRGIETVWEGEGASEVGRDSCSGVAFERSSQGKSGAGLGA